MIVKETLESPIQSFFLALPPSTLIKQGIESMAKARTSCVLIVENQKLIGIFTERDAVQLTSKKSLISTLTLAELMTTKVITLKASETEDIFALSRLFSKHRIRHLPIIDNLNQVVGIVTPQSLRNVMKPEHLLRYIRVQEVMNKKVIHALPDTSIFVLSQTMASHRASCIVIIDPSTFYPVGIVTERDIVQFLNLNLDFAQVSAQSVMSTPLSTVKPQDSLWSVHQEMQKLKIRRLVITKQTGELAGIVTQTQMLKILDPMEMFLVMQQMQEIIDHQMHELLQLNQKLQIKNTELAHLSTVDELTGIVNRRRLNEFLHHEWQCLANRGKPLSVIMCDVDCFKAYNDEYGHLAGDECLVKIAQTLRSVTRQTSDVVARYGGEEFTVVLPNTDHTGAERVAKTILNQIQNLKIPHSSSSIANYVTVSLGVATVNPDQSRSPAMLLQIADQLLYQSKQQGRNTYTIKHL